jgi:16S rRNA (uracil1498-N3)-methyltransferase
VVDPRETKLERLGRVAIAASKQCGMPHLLRIEPKVEIDQLASLQSGARLIVAAAGGEPWEDRGDEALVLAIGPEGDWTSDELDRLRGAGASVCSFGPHVMRIETAAVAASAIIMGRATVLERT